MTGVYDPFAQGLAGLTDPDAPILIYNERDRENQRLQQEQEERERARAQQKRAGDETVAAEPAATPRREPALAKSAASEPAKAAEDDPEATSAASHTGGGLGMGFLLLAAVAVTVMAFLFGPKLLKGKEAAPAVASAPAAPVLPVAAPGAPMSEPAQGGLPEPEMPAVAAAVPIATAPEPEPVATQASLAAASDRIDANHQALAESRQTIEALNTRVAELEQQLAARPDTARVEALEQKLAALEERAARPASAPARAHPSRVVAPKPKVEAEAAKPRAPEPRLLAIDSWDGTPSVIVGLDTPGDRRTRTLQPGESLNGVRLESVDMRLGTATFTTADGKLVTLNLSGGAR